MRNRWERSCSCMLKCENVFFIFLFLWAGNVLYLIICVIIIISILMLLLTLVWKMKRKQQSKTHKPPHTYMVTSTLAAHRHINRCCPPCFQKKKNEWWVSFLPFVLQRRAGFLVPVCSPTETACFTNIANKNTTVRMKIKKYSENLFSCVLVIDQANLAVWDKAQTSETKGPFPSTAKRHHFEGQKVRGAALLCFWSNSRKGPN